MEKSERICSTKRKGGGRMKKSDWCFFAVIGWDIGFLAFMVMWIVAMFANKYDQAAFYLLFHCWCYYHAGRWRKAMKKELKKEEVVA